MKTYNEEKMRKEFEKKFVDTTKPFGWKEHAYPDEVFDLFLSHLEEYKERVREMIKKEHAELFYISHKKWWRKFTKVEKGSKNYSATLDAYKEGRNAVLSKLLFSDLLK